MKRHVSFVILFGLSLCSTAFADRGGAGGFRGAPAAGHMNNGGYHDNRGYNHGYDRYHRNNAWYGDEGVVVNNGEADEAWYDDGLNDEHSTNAVIGVPEGGYYDPSCQTVQTCDSNGQCVTQQNCE